MKYFVWRAERSPDLHWPSSLIFHLTNPHSVIGDLFMDSTVTEDAAGRLKNGKTFQLGRREVGETRPLSPLALAGAAAAAVVGASFESANEMRSTDSNIGADFSATAQHQTHKDRRADPPHCWRR